LRRCLAIARSEVTIAFQSSRLLRRFLLVAWMPILYFCPFFLAIGYVADPNNELESGAMLTELAREFVSTEVIGKLREDPQHLLPAIWSIAFYLFFAWTQSFLSMIVVAIVGPPLIARDHQTKAFLVYFSKPIQAWQYLFGKLSSLVFFVFSMTLVPALFLYTISIALSPDVSTLTATLPILLEVVLASLMTAIPIGMVVLLISSLTRDRRIATFAWLLLWIFGEIAFRVLTASSALSGNYQPPAWASLLSLRELTMRAVSGIFGVRGNIETLLNELGSSSEGLSRNLLRLADDMGDAAVMERPHSVLQFTDLAGLGLSPGLSALALIALSIACGLIILRRARRAVRI